MLNNQDRMSTVFWQREDIVTDISDKWLGWLTDRGSLTEKLSFTGGCKTKIHVLSEGWDTPDKTELTRLGMEKTQERYYIRRVQLRLNNTPQVYARSVFPESTLIFTNQKLRRLGATSLGQWLFSHPDTVRQYFEIAEINSNLLAEDAAAASGEMLYGRRSVFLIASHYPILVSEFFLSEMP